jgi:PAS domain S-box-containing protein
MAAGKLDRDGAIYLAGGGEMGERTRRMGWSSTPVGPIEAWPQSLKTAVSICLGSRHPMVIWWGKEHLTQFYNEGFISFLGASKHPQALGQSGRECWREIWHIIDPMLEGVFATGDATWSEDFLYVIDRNLPREEGYFTFSYSPIRDDSGAIGGIFCACSETTSRVISERRLQTLRDLGRMKGEAKTAEVACELAARAFGENPGDIPFALIYLLEGEADQARLVATTALEAGHAAAPARIALRSAQGTAASWPLQRVLDAGTAQLVPNVSVNFGPLSGGLWPESPEAALILPIAVPAQAKPIGFLVAGLSPRRVIDADYKSFLELVSGHIGTSIASARAFEEERKRAEALAEIDRAKTAFFSNVSHEFRTPLTLMLGPLEDALAGPRYALPQRREDLALVHRNSLRLLRLVNTLLDFSRIEAGRVEACYEPVDLSSYTAELASVFRAAVEKAGLRLTVDCPPQGEPVWIDREMWEKIVLNLLSNAFKFTLAGGITVRLRQNRASAVLAVKDTGSGIPEREIPRLFDRFRRVEGACGRTHEGTGIGLALVQGLAKLHGGRVRAKSLWGKGSTFTVTIPLGTAHLPPDRLRAGRTIGSTALGAQPYVAEALRWLADGDSGNKTGFGIERAILPERPLVASGKPGERAKILLADDNADMRDYVRHLLSPRYDVRAVANGEEALAVLRAEAPPDLLVSDIMMPRMDGYQLLRAIRSDPALVDLPVVFLSARAGEEASVEGLEAGADDYLVKPFSARELDARIASNLEKAQLRRQRRQAETEYRRLAAIAENSTDFIGISDAELRPIYVNEAGRQLVGLDSIDFIGQNSALHYFAPEERARIVREVYPAVVKQGRWRGETTLRHFKTGVRIPVLCDVFRIDDPTTEESVSFATVTRDITERRHAEAALRDANLVLEERVKKRTRELKTAMERRRKAEAALQQAQRLEAIGQLTGGIAHDFNNLLTIVIGQTEAIMLAAKDDVRITRMASAALRAAERGAQLTGQLLAFSGHQQLQLETVAVDQLLLDAGDLARRAVGETITVKVSAHRQLWPSRLDPVQFESAILNLAINARDAMPDGGHLTIAARNATVSADNAKRLDLTPGEYVVLRVTDTGVGMAAEVQRRAFEPFFTTKDVGKGTGLGLAQIFGFAKQSGGTATIDSVSGKGTTVRLYLPRATSPITDEELSSRDSKMVRGHGRTILVVEDQPDVRDMIEMSLGDLDYRILTAPDGMAAREVLKSDEAIDLLLTDIVMPNGVSGLELAKEAQRLREGLGVVVVSGYHRDFENQMDEASGLIFLEKPFRPTELADTIADVLGSRGK